MNVLYIIGHEFGFTVLHSRFSGMYENSHIGVRSMGLGYKADGPSEFVTRKEVLHTRLLQKSAPLTGYII